MCKNLILMSQVVFLVTFGHSTSAFGRERSDNATTSELEITQNFQEYIKFMRNPKTVTFASDGVPWSESEDLLISGQKTADGGCRFSSERSWSTEEARPGIHEIEVEQAVNQETCQSLVRRGVAPNSTKNVISWLRELSSVSGALPQYSKISAANAVASGEPFKHVGHIRNLFDDGNHPLWQAINGSFAITIGSANAGFEFFPHLGGTSSNSTAQCISPTPNANWEYSSNSITNSGSLQGWSVDQFGCIAVLRQSGATFEGIYQDQGEKVTGPTGRVAGLCNAIRYSNYACSSDRYPASMFAATQGTLTNKTDVCVGNACVFQCSPNGGLKININRHYVRFNPAAGFSDASDVTVTGGAETTCRRNVRRTITRDFRAYAPCEAGDSNCH